MGREDVFAGYLVYPYIVHTRLLSEQEHERDL
jgi:hypothetical protein